MHCCIVLSISWSVGIIGLRIRIFKGLYSFSKLMMPFAALRQKQLVEITFSIEHVLMDLKRNLARESEVQAVVHDEALRRQTRNQSRSGSVG